jgi:hypothetical protein
VNACGGPIDGLRVGGISRKTPRASAYASSLRGRSAGIAAEVVVGS